MLVEIFLFISTCFHLSLSAPIPYPGFFERKNLLPPLLRDPLATLIGETCYVSLVEDFNITDTLCLKYALSKVLGFGIVFGSAIIKVPQMVTIISKRSAKGLSLASYYLETYAYIIILAYNLRQANPFSTYGEVVFIASQNVLITLMIFWYGRRPTSSSSSILWTLNCNAAAFIGVFCVLLVPSWIPDWLLSSLYAITIPMTLASKLPQIYTNYENQSTGQLSVFAVLNYFAGTTARVFTTMTELDDPLMLAGNVLASLLNGVLVMQVYLYWGKSMNGSTVTTTIVNEDKMEAKAD
ncbi:uncharacterized protein BX664DRAFT_284471 [Halteromyces radiatus]|uniref:uncharacterized protein n=1 Tax=Halteromyces radiatus TaxID=101107 RepID=UPI00221E6BEC|nr:uncharacterized protein BX664DRAFT_284471 [Halteromyces radiatus]KAI8082762.1 hypothetical protein BX664DRAFT_284471 [Halteromyces radiatus]